MGGMLRRAEQWVLFVGSGALVALVLPWAILAGLVVFDRMEAFRALFVSPRVRLLGLYPIRGIVALALFAFSLRVLFGSTPHRLWITSLLVVGVALHALLNAANIAPAHLTPDVIPALLGYLLLAAYYVPRLLGWKGPFNARPGTHQ
jgi:hypothetical protein